MVMRFAWDDAREEIACEKPSAAEERARQFRAWLLDVLDMAREAAAAGVEPAEVLESLRALKERSRKEKQP